jgi:hypothetical protein
MSVLACTIGSLIVLLAVMSLSAVGASRVSEQRTEESLAARAIDELHFEAEREPLEEAESSWRDVDDALASHGFEAGLPIPRIEHLMARRREEAESIKTLAALRVQLRDFERDRKRIETSIAVLESRRETLPILIDPTGLSKRWKPFFIECDAGGATAYRATDDFQYFVPREDLSTSGDFGRYLRRIRATPGALLVLLVRPDGIATARRARAVASGAQIRVARLPLPGTGSLDWALLRAAEGES